MYIYEKKRVDKNGNKASFLQLCVSYRDKNGKPKRKMILHLGKKGDPKIETKLKEMANKMNRVAGIYDVVDLHNDIFTTWSRHIGPKLVFRKLWEELKFDFIFHGNYHEHIFMLVLNRLCDPQSKLACMDWKEEVYEPMWDDIKLYDLYFALDWLMKNKEIVEVQMFNNIRNLFNQSIDLMLFDTTSVSYWGEGEYAPNLLKFGHSKEKRSDLKQLVVGLLMTGNGIPVGHEVFSGNQVDVRNFPQIITKVKDKFGLLSRIVWVCDRGMISESNISLLESIKHEYIIGVRMRMLNAAQQQVLLVDKLKDFKKIHDNLYVKEVILDVEVEIPEEEKEGNENKHISDDRKKKEKKTKIVKRRFIICHNPEKADEDAIKRAHFKEIITRKVLEKADKTWIVKNGFKKYLKLKEDIIESINYEKLEKEKIYDGKWVLLTNTELDYTEIAKYYKSLWQIESAFRELKSSLDVKPMYHWVDRRIRGHIFICFLALVMELCFRNKLGEKVSYSDVMNDLKKLQATLLKVKDKEVIKRNEPVGMANIAIRQLKLELPGINLL
jgi:transposase